MEIKFIIDGNELEVSELEYRMILGGLLTMDKCLSYKNSPAGECIAPCCSSHADWEAQKERSFIYLESKLHWDWQKKEGK